MKNYFIEKHFDNTSLGFCYCFCSKSPGFHFGHESVNYSSPSFVNRFRVFRIISSLVISSSNRNISWCSCAVCIGNGNRRYSCRTWHLVNCGWMFWFVRSFRWHFRFIFRRFHQWHCHRHPRPVCSSFAMLLYFEYQITPGMLWYQPHK